MGQTAAKLGATIADLTGETEADRQRTSIPALHGRELLSAYSNLQRRETRRAIRRLAEALAAMEISAEPVGRGR